MYKNKGITLVSLVITIILSIILAGISLQAFTGSGLFGQAIKSKEQAELAELEEQMNLTITEMIAYKNGEKITVDDYINYLSENMNITDRYEENGKQIIELDGKYIFEISEEDSYISVDKVGIKGKLLPIIVLESIANKTNSITVKVSTKRNEGGKIEYYIKAEDEEEYTLKETTTDESYIYEGLEQNKKYSIKIVAIAENKQTAEVTRDVLLGSVPDLIEGDVTFTYSVDGQEIDRSTWTNKEVTVTVSTTVKGYTLQTSKDGRNWSNLISQTFDENGDIYVALYDGTNYGGSATGNVRNIDTTEPVASISGTTTNSITFTGTDTASTTKNENASGIAGYIVQQSSTAPAANSTSWTSYNGTSKTVSGLTQGKTYYVFVKDKAGNVSAAASKGTGTVTGLTAANITFTYSPSSWTNGSVKVTAALKDMTSSYTLKITDSNPVGASKQTALGWTDASAGITVSTNKTIYAVLIDNEGQIGAAATGNVDKIDTVAPTISTALSSTAKGIDSVTLSIGITDTKSGLGKIEWYYGTTENPTTLAGTTKVTDLNGSTAGPTTAQTKTYTVSGLSAATPYFFKVIAYDVAGKTVTSSVINVTTNNPTAADVSYTPIDTSWGVDNVKSALDSLYSR